MSKSFQTIKSGDSMPPLSRSFAFNRASINEDSRTVPITFSTETEEVERWFGREILDHSPKSVRLGRANSGAPLLLDHNSREQIGVIESAAIKGKEGQAVVRFSKSARAEEIFQDVKDGIRSKVSVGYRVHSMVLESEDDENGSTYRINDWEPFEVSIVSIPADNSAGIRSTAESVFGQRSAELSTAVRLGDNTPTSMKTEGNTPEPAEPIIEPKRSADPAPPAVAPVAAPVAKAEPEARAADPIKLDNAEIERIANERASQEIDRRESIGEIAKRFGIDATEQKRAIKDGESVDAFKLRVLDHLESSNPAFAAPKTVNENEVSAKAGSRAFTIETWGRSVEKLPTLAGRVQQSVQIESPDLGRNYIGGEGNTFHRSLTGAMTLLDVTKLDAGIGSAVIDETVIHSPELMVFPASVITGATVDLSVRTGTPTVGYRNANEGRDFKRGTFESKVFQTSVIEEPIGVDIQGVLNASRDPGRVLFNEAKAVTDAVLQHVAQQMWYAGSAQSIADAKCAPGLYAQAQTGADHVVNATGSTAKTSVWFLELGEDSLDSIWGNDSTLNFGDSWEEGIIEDANGKKLRGLTNWISGRNALRLSNKNKAIRIKNVGTDSGKGLTDALLFSALELAVNLGLNPNAIFMTGRSQFQLQSSRTATNATGAPVPVPREWEGIPIYATRNLLNAETV